MDLVIHETSDPEVVVAEFSYQWRMPDPMSVACICVVRVRNGQIVESRDYADPVASSRVIKRMAEPREAEGEGFELPRASGPWRESVCGLPVTASGNRRGGRRLTARPTN